MKLDRIECRILEILQQHGRISNVELADRVGLSESACLRRVRSLEQTGAIARYAAIVERRSLGFTLTAFVLVSMEKRSDGHIDEFHDRMRADPHVIECHAMSGSHDYLLKVIARDVDHFSELVLDGVLKYPGVRHVESSFSLAEIKQVSAVPTQGAPIA